MAQYKKVKSKQHPFIDFAINSANSSEWYIKIHDILGEHDEFKGGEYLVRLELPAEYPYKPPGLSFMTPNGVFALTGAICISIGTYDTSEYRSVLGIEQFAENIVSALIGWSTLGEGYGILNNITAAQISELAAQSKTFNAANYSDVMLLFESSNAG